MLNGRREEILSQTAAELDLSGTRVAIVPGCISNAEVTKKFVATAIERFGGVDVLVNNAGIFNQLMIMFFPKPHLCQSWIDLRATNTGASTLNTVIDSAIVHCTGFIVLYRRL